jgi:hypothetical protein
MGHVYHPWDRKSIDFQKKILIICEVTIDREIAVKILLFKIISIGCPVETHQSRPLDGLKIG